MDDFSKSRLEDWVRLILVNWVYIYFVIFYAIVVGGLSGLLMVYSAGQVWGAGALFPLGSLARGTVAAVIAGVFIGGIRIIRYDPRTGEYGVASPGRSLFRLVRLGGAQLGGLAILALAAGWIGGS
jgi:hypothetical protein